MSPSLAGRIFTTEGRPLSLCQVPNPKLYYQISILNDLGPVANWNIRWTAKGGMPGQATF